MSPGLGSFFFMGAIFQVWGNDKNQISTQSAVPSVTASNWGSFGKEVSPEKALSLLRKSAETKSQRNNGGAPKRDQRKRKGEGVFGVFHIIEHKTTQS